MPGPGECRAPEPVEFVRAEELQLAPVRVVNTKLGFVEDHARDRTGKVLGHVPRRQLRLAVGREDVSVEPAPTQVVQRRVRHGWLQRPEASSFPRVVHRGELPARFVLVRHVSSRCDHAVVDPTANGIENTVEQQQGVTSCAESVSQSV